MLVQLRLELKFGCRSLCVQLWLDTPIETNPFWKGARVAPLFAFAQTQNRPLSPLFPVCILIRYRMNYFYNRYIVIVYCDFIFWNKNNIVVCGINYIIGTT